MTEAWCHNREGPLQNIPQHIFRQVAHREDPLQLPQKLRTLQFIIKCQFVQSAEHNTTSLPLLLQITVGGGASNASAFPPSNVLYAGN